MSPPDRTLSTKQMVIAFAVIEAAVLIPLVVYMIFFR